MIQNGLAIVVKRKEIALKVAAAQSKARLKARRIRNRYLNIARAHAHVHRLRGGLIQFKRRIARANLGIQAVGHGARKLNVSRVQRYIQIMTRNARDRQVARPYIRRNAHQVIRNISRQFNGDRAVNRSLVIAVELADLERRALDLSQILVAAS